MRPAIVGIAGTSLNPAEADCLAAHAPAGLILFARNIDTQAQLQALTTSLRAILPADSVLMVDQEGGRVARLRPPHWRAHPPARRLGEIFSRDAEAGSRAAWLTGALIGLDCAAAGFDVVAAPVLDVAAPDGHDVIGDRAFSADPEAVAELGVAMASGLLAAGIQPVGKHVPGHGRARADSHLALPELAGIEAADLLPFRRAAGLPWLMTAHIRYISADMEHPATHSATIIRDVIRRDVVRHGAEGAPDIGSGIGFAGVLVSDDLAMHALTGTPGARAAAAIAAGCDIALHCSGVLEETLDVLRSIPDIPPVSLARLRTARAVAARSRVTLDGTSLDAERGGLLA